MQDPKRNKNSRLTEFEPLQSVTNLKYAEPSFLDQVHTSYQSDPTNINQSRIIKQLRIGLQQDKSGLPSYVRSQIASKIKLTPLFLLSIFKQFHILYLIVLTGILPLKFLCIKGFEWQGFTLNILIVILYITSQCIGRYIMFQGLTKFIPNNDTEYEFWNNEKKKWMKIEEKQIKVGQILKIKKKMVMITEQDSSDEIINGNKVRVSVNLLPIFCSSGKNNIQLDTFDINKEQERRNIKIDQRFQNYYQSTNLLSTQREIFIQYSIRNCRINYFFSNLGNQQFEAVLQFQDIHEDKKITNSDIITNGAYFCEEDYVVGVVLFSLQTQKMNYLRYMLMQKNTITTFLGYHLFRILLWIFVFVIILLVLNTIVSSIVYGTLSLQFYHCYTLNYIATLSFSMNAIMYLVLGIHHLWDSITIQNRCNLTVNNYIKSVDQFGMADTFLLDQYTFVKKNILAVTAIDINSQVRQQVLSERLILYCIKQSKQFKKKFPKQWLSLSFDYKQNYKKNQRISNSHSEEVNILGQIIDISGAVRIIICIKYFDKFKRTKYFIIRFNDKVIFSILQSMSFEKKQRFSETILQAKKKGQLMVMTQILHIDENCEIDLSLNTYQLEYRFYCLIRMKFIRDREGSKFVKQIQNKHNIVVMTSNPFEYFDQILITTGMKSKNCITLIFQEAEQNIFIKDLEQRYNQIDNYKLTGTSKKQKSKKNLIIALDSSLIVYMAQGQVRSLLKKISQRATYLIFYNATQFQKQLCATNIFKIFPKNIFLSNFAVDSIIFRLSNLSISIEGHSANRFSTVRAKNYTQLKKFICQVGPASTELTTIIIKSHIFKNQIFISSMIFAMFIVYKGSFFYLSAEYSIYIFYIYNIGFTMLPLILYFFIKPKILKGIMIQNLIIQHNLAKNHILGFFLGLFVTYIAYSVIPEYMLEQIFVNILINCVIMGNLYYLVLDNSKNKKWQIISIVIQLIFSIGIIQLGQYFPGLPHNIFSLGIIMSPLSSDLTMYFVGTYVIEFIIVIMILLFLAINKMIINRQVFVKNNIDRERQQKTNGDLQNRKIYGKVSRSSGKQFRFKGANIKNEYF